MLQTREEIILSVIDRIAPLDTSAAEAATVHSNHLTKPVGSLGKLEELAVQLAGITGELWPDLSKRAVIVMAADHGVCEEGVSAYPAEVTPQMVFNFLAGGAAVNVLARQSNAEVVCVDIGVNSDLSGDKLVSRKLRRGTANIALGPAMLREEAAEAVGIGIEMVEQLYKEGYRMFATGEMGIGNTTASSAIVSVLAGIDPEQSVGLGTGIDEERRRRKVEVVRQAISVNTPDAEDALDVLAKVGGLEIAGLVGVIIGAASLGCPVVIDGFISSAAALAAARLAPQSLPYMIGSHQSMEQGHPALLSELGLKSLLHLDMRLGEGTGAVLCFNLIDAALRIMQEMATFDSAGVSRSEE